MKALPPIVVVSPCATHEAFNELKKNGYLPIYGRPHYIEVKGLALDADSGFWERVFFSLFEWRRQQRVSKAERTDYDPKAHQAAYP